MKKNLIYVFLLDGYLDWEISYDLPELAKSGRFIIMTTGITKRPVLSMGGLVVIPSISIEEILMENAALFLIPGGRAWEEKKYREVLPLIPPFVSQGIPVAAICSATTLLADAGLLNEVQHTSNGLQYLSTLSLSYQGDKFYEDSPAVRDKHIITATGTAPVEFAREIFRELELYNPADLDKWFNLFKHGLWKE